MNIGADALRFHGNNVADFGKATNTSAFTNFTLSFWVRDAKAGTDSLVRSVLSYGYKNNGDGLLFAVGKQNLAIFYSFVKMKNHQIR